FDIYSQPDIRDPAGLKGGTIGVTQAGATTDYAARAFARHYGLEIGRDLEVSFAGSTPAMVAALSNRLISAGVLSPPSNLMARDAGMHKLVALSDLHLPFEHTALAARRSWVQANQDTVRRFLAAMAQGTEMTRSNADVAMKAIGEYMRIEDPEQ